MASGGRTVVEHSPHHPRSRVRFPPPLLPPADGYETLLGKVPIYKRYDDFFKVDYL